MGTTLRALLTIALLGVALAGCATSGTPGYRNSFEYVVPTAAGRVATVTSGVTHYVNTEARRVCYAFVVPGVWEPGRETGMVRRADGRGLVGVVLMSVRELGGSSIDDAIHRAAARSDDVYRAERAGVASRLTPDPTIPGTWRWEVPGDIKLGEGRAGRIIPRWYLPVGQDWIAQFSIGHPPGATREAFAAEVIRSLTTSREPRCYEAQLREIGAFRTR